MAKSQWSFATAAELSAALKARKVSAVELAQDAIGRIERHDAKVNAVCVRDFTRGLEAARAADVALARGESKPLLGIPMTVKESYNVGGLPTTWGFPAQKDFTPPEDALSISRVKAAGGVILGKTNVPLALGDWQSYNDIYGITNNPFDLSRTPGGSSGGSAAALAAGYGPLSLGSDIGGSLRVPAFHCGVYAHKPTFALVPPRGHTPPPLPPLPLDRDLAVIGPMARSAADLSLVLDVIAGPDPIEAGKAYQLALPSPRHGELNKFRVLLIDTDPLLPTDTVMRAAIEKLACKSRQGRRCRGALEPAAARLRRLDAALYADADVVPGGLVPAGDLCGRERRRGKARSRRYQSCGGASARHRAQPPRLADGRWRSGAAAGAMARAVQELRRRDLPDDADACLSA